MRSPTPPPVASDSPRVGDEQGSSWRPAPLVRVASVSSDAPETYAMFRPDEVLSGPRSAAIRRLEAEMVGCSLDDIYSTLAMPWQIDRRDVNEPHGNDWDTLRTSPDFWISTDTGKLVFASVAEGDAALPGLPGQHYKPVGKAWEHCADVTAAPGNVGGFHCCCVDTSQPGTRWTLVARLADFGVVVGREAGLRVEFAALVRSDCEGLVASVGPHDECRSLFLVEEMQLSGGGVLLVDPAEREELVVVAGEEEGDGGIEVSAGMGAGYYPVFVSRDAAGLVCRITAVFHPGRASKVLSRFPPAD